MSDELEPLGPLALRALAAEKGRGDVDAAMQERLLGRVVATVAVGAAVTAVASSAAAAAGKAGAGAGASAGAGAAATGAAGAGASVASGLTIKALPWIIGAFVLGGGAGAGMHAAVVAPPPAPPQATERVVPSASPVLPALPATSAEPALSSMPVWLAAVGPPHRGPRAAPERVDRAGRGVRRK